MPVPDHGGRKLNHAACYATMRQEITCQYKKRDRHDLEFFNTGKQLQRDGLYWHLGHREQESQDC